MAADLRKRSLTAFEGAGYTPRALMARRPDQDPWHGMSTGWSVVTLMLGAVLAWGGIGFLIDWLAGTGKVFTAIGMVVGAAGGVYLIYMKYGRDHDEKP